MRNFMLKKALLTAICVQSVFASGSALAQEPFEVLGFKIGDSFSTLNKSLEGEAGKYEISTWAGQLRIKNSPKYNSKIEALGMAGDEWFMALFSSPPKSDHMVRAARHVKFAPQDAPLASALETQLTNRYGESSFRATGRGWVSLVWARTPEGLPLESAKAKKCKLDFVYTASQMIDLNYRLNLPSYCGETMWVYISKGGRNPDLLREYYASLYNEDYKRGLDAETDAFYAQQRQIENAQQSQSAKSKKIKF